ncbi:hypothetical protein GJ496_007746 [Pomphorhynchus laevis]|nr:hypothetical protein GJ496_007746 [Pomphorhynchus laevis]
MCPVRCMRLLSHPTWVWTINRTKDNDSRCSKNSRIGSKRSSRNKNRTRSHYIDDVIVDNGIVETERVIAAFERYGIELKPAETIDGSRVHGLQVRSDGSQLKWSRAGYIPKFPSKLTKRDLYSWCGELFRYYPITCWLQIWCSFIKRSASAESLDQICSQETKYLATFIEQQVMEHDPVRGKLGVSTVGAALDINGAIVEDKEWFRKLNDNNHINLAELESVPRRINIALSSVDDFCRRQGCEIRFICGYWPWINDIIERSHRTIKRMAARTDLRIKIRFDAGNCLRTSGEFQNNKTHIEKNFSSMTCYRPWRESVITGYPELHVVEVKGIVRHRNDVRLILSNPSDNNDVPSRRSRRIRRPT